MCLSLQRFLQQTGGRQGGWDDYDHNTFLKTRTNCNRVRHMNDGVRSFLNVFHIRDIFLYSLGNFKVSGHCGKGIAHQDTKGAFAS